MEKRKDKLLTLRTKIQEVYELADELDLGNIFYNEGFIELFLAEDLGHTWNKKTQGPDGFDTAGHPVEYKIRSSPNGTFQFHWLSEKKMSRLAEIERVYFATRNRTAFAEVYEIEMDNLLPTLNERWHRDDSGGHRSYSLEELIRLGAVQVG